MAAVTLRRAILALLLGFTLALGLGALIGQPPPVTRDETACHWEYWCNAR